MRPGTYNLALYRGDTYAWKFTLYEDNPAPPTPATPSDLTGVTAKAEIRTTPGGTVMATLACVITLPNVITMKMTTPAWANVTARQAAWDLQLTYDDPDASIITILHGSVAITADVTDSQVITATTLDYTFGRSSARV